MKSMRRCVGSPYFKSRNEKVRAFLYKNYQIEPHHHEFYEINIVLHGSGIHTIEDISIPVQTGDIFVIPPMSIHSYHDSNTLDVFHIVLSKNFFVETDDDTSSVPGFLQLMEIEPFLRQQNPEKLFLHLTHSQLSQLKADLAVIEDGNEFDTADMLFFKNHTAWKIIYWLSALFFRQLHSADKKSTNKHHQAVICALEYIHQNYNEKITIDQLCKETFLSRSTLLRNFYDVCGCTPIHYLNQYRCEKAITMLESTDLSKTEIAQRCGFYDLSHMKHMLDDFSSLQNTEKN